MSCSSLDCWSARSVVPLIEIATASSRLTMASKDDAIALNSATGSGVEAGSEVARDGIGPSLPGFDRRTRRWRVVSFSHVERCHHRGSGPTSSAACFPAGVAASRGTGNGGVPLAPGCL
jgi:hypothetical protein